MKIKAKSVIVGLLLVGLALTAGMPVSLLMDAGENPTGRLNESAPLADGALGDSVALSALEDHSVQLDALDLFSDGFALIEHESSDNISVSVNGTIITFDPAPDWNGIETVDLTAAYAPPEEIPNPPPQYTPTALGAGESAMSSYTYEYLAIEVTIFPVNDAPRLNYCLAPLSVQKGAEIPEFIDLAPMFTDVDGDALVYSVAALGGGLTPFVSGDSLGLSVGTEFGGYETIVVTASDLYLAACSYILVSIDEPYQLSMSEDALLEVNPADFFTSGTVDQATVLSMGSLGTAQFSEDGGEWTLGLQGPQDWSGGTYVTAYVEATWWIAALPIPGDPYDGNSICSLPGHWHHENVFMTFQVDVGAVNDPPQVKCAQPVIVVTEEDVPIYFALDMNDIFTDVDSALTFSYAANGDDVEILLTGTGIVNILPAANFYGTRSFALRASDGEYTAECSMVAQVDAVDDSIVSLSGNDTLVMNEDATARLNLSSMFYDQEGVTGYNASSSDNFTAAIDMANLTASVTPLSDWNGIEPIVISGTDGNTTTEKSIIVVVRPVNDAPVLLSDIAPTIINEDSSISVELPDYFLDIDSALGYTFNTICTHISMSVADGALTITPNEDWNGDATVTVTASDSESSVSSAFAVSVAPVNDPPTLVKAIDPVTMNEDSAAIINLADHFTDVDSVLAFTSTGSANIYPSISPGMVATISLSPNWSGSGAVQLSATDGEYWLNETIPAIALAVNDPPVVSGHTHAIAVGAGNSTVVDLSSLFFDADGDALAISAESDGNLSLDLNNNLLAIGTDHTQNGQSHGSFGPHTIRLIASDGSSAVETFIDVVIVQNNQPGPAQAGLPIEIGYGLSGGLMLACALAIAGFALYARSTVRNRSVGVRSRRQAVGTIV